MQVFCVAHIPWVELYVTHPNPVLQPTKREHSEEALRCMVALLWRTQRKTGTVLVHSEGEW